jgi:hypothetical protein
MGLSISMLSNHKLWNIVIFLDDLPCKYGDTPNYWSFDP